MMSSLPQEWINELIEQNDITAVIGEVVELKRKSNRMWGCCPFHSEKTASFSISPDKQLFYCFGCHAGGNVIHFVMQYEKLGFLDAVKQLAARINMMLPEVIDDEKLRREHALKQRLYGANKDAALYFFNQLKSSRGREARKYLNNRGISNQTIVRFGLGYALDSWDGLLTYLQSKGYTTQEIIASGLAVKKNEGAYDAFRNRVMFPIIATSQKVIGFGARLLGDGKPKYLNTNDTLIFNKRRNLYGLNSVKTNQTGNIIVVEGYMDVIGLSQAGVSNVIATLGTAFAKQQAQLIKRFSNKVYVAYDGDAAGQNAAMRSLDILSEQGIQVFVIEMPENIDPDEFIRANNNDVEAFNQLVENAFSLHAFKLKKIIAEFDLTKEDQRIQCATKASAFIGTLSPVEQEQFIKKLSLETGFSVESLQKQGKFAQFNGVAPNNANSSGNYRNNRINNKAMQTNRISGENRKTGQKKELERMSYETILIKAAAGNETFAKAAFELQKNDTLFKIPAYINFLKLLQENPQANESVALLNQLDEKEASTVAAALALQESCDDNETFNANVQEIRRIDYLSELEALQLEIYNPDTKADRRRECIKRISQLNSLLLS